MDQIRVEQFALLFAGLTRAKGRYVSVADPSQLVVGDKAKGKATTITEPVTIDDYRRHLTGEASLGIVPIRDDGTCVFGAIDIDQYAGLDHQGLVNAIKANNVDAMVCRSKSGGAHVYTFIQEPGVKAPALIEYLKKLRSKLGIDYRKAREIFPKQTKQSGGIGNWINLPYFGDSARRAVNSPSTDYSLEEFLDTVKRLNPSELEQKTDDALLIPSELPPCLERMAAEGIPAGQRNEALFNYTVFSAKKFKLDRPNTIKMLDVINARVCQPPVPSREMMTTLDSVLKHEYNYRCDQSPLVDYCDKTACSMRPFGPSASMRPSNIPEIEKIEIMGDESGETRYHIKLSNCPKMIICDSRALFDYELLRRHVVDTIHMFLPAVKKKDWDAYITSRWAVLSETMRVSKERTRSGMSEALIDEWLRQHLSENILDFQMGSPYLDSGQVYILLTGAARILKPIAPGQKMDLTGAAIYLEDTGWEKADKMVEGKTYNTWTRSIDPQFKLAKKVETVVEVGGDTAIELPVSDKHPDVQYLEWGEYAPQHEENS